MVKRRRGPPARPSVARYAEDKDGTISEMAPPENGAAEADAPELPVTEDHTPSVHDTLLETVSAEAIEVAGGHPAPASAAAPAEPETTEPEASGPEDAAIDTAPAEEAGFEETAPAPMEPPEGLMEPPEALEAAPDADPAPVADPVAATEAVAVTTVAETATAATEMVAAPDVVLNRTREAIRTTSAVSVDVMGEIAEANATLLTFLRNEGSAAVAHWQSLSGAKTPADLLRLQVGEMQRAADASLTCFSALARRAGRLASGIGRT